MKLSVKHNNLFGVMQDHPEYLIVAFQIITCIVFLTDYFYVLWLLIEILKAM